MTKVFEDCSSDKNMCSWESRYSRPFQGLPYEDVVFLSATKGQAAIDLGKWWSVREIIPFYGLSSFRLVNYIYIYINLPIDDNMRMINHDKPRPSLRFLEDVPMLTACPAVRSAALHSQEVKQNQELPRYTSRCIRAWTHAAHIVFYAFIYCYYCYTICCWLLVWR